MAVYGRLAVCQIVCVNSRVLGFVKICNAVALGVPVTENPPGEVVTFAGYQSGYLSVRGAVVVATRVRGLSSVLRQFPNSYSGLELLIPERALRRGDALVASSSPSCIHARLSSFWLGEKIAAWARAFGLYLKSHIFSGNTPNS